MRRWLILLLLCMLTFPVLAQEETEEPEEVIPDAMPLVDTGDANIKTSC